MNSVGGEYGFRMEIPYMAGIYLAINAIKNSYLVVDGPMCAFYKIEQIQGNHDLTSQLARLALPHRIVHTELAVNDAVMGEEKSVVEKLEGVDGLDDCSAIYLTGLSSAVLIGRDQERLAANFKSQHDNPVLPIKSRTLSGDWLDGWAETLEITAQNIPLVEKTSSKKTKIGIVGNLFLRNEGDSIGNVKELEEIIKALDAEPVSIWLSGQSYDELGEIGQADLLVSLPYAKKAAEILQERTGADLIELPLPFSWQQTEEFILLLAEKLDKTNKAKTYISQELSQLIDISMFISEEHLLMSKWMVLGDPHHMRGWTEIAANAGAKIAGLISSTQPHHIGGEKIVSSDNKEHEIKFGSNPDWHKFATNFIDERAIDLVISNGFGFNLLNSPRVLFYEFGYPCYSYHVPIPIPALGFKGEAVILSRIGELFHRKKAAQRRKKFQKKTTQTWLIVENSTDVEN